MIPAPLPPPAVTRPVAIVDPGVLRAAASGRTHVIVVFRSARTSRTLAATVGESRRLRAAVLARTGDAFRPTARWDAVLAVPGSATSAGIRRLAADPDVARIGLDPGGRLDDAESDALIGADVAQQSGLTGKGVTAAVLDSGVDRSHPDLTGAIVDEHCFIPPSSCPNGAAEQGGLGSAQDDNGHGTAVTAILAGRGSAAPIGVAPAASIVAVKVTDRQSRFGSASQVISGLNWIALEHPEVRVVNMSLGSDELFSGACDNASAYTLAYASAVASLRARGAVVFAASGNNGSATSMAAPACIESVVAVGAVYDSGVGSFSAFGCGDATTEADQPACFSNSGPQLDLLAPGAPITSARLGGGSGVFWGTSEATPHAAGAAALLFESDPRAAPDRVESLLETSGKPVRDARNARVTPRVDVAAALRLGKIPAAPEALVSSDALAFGKVRVRRTATRSVGVSNPGTVPVTVTVSRPAAPFAAGAPRSFAVQPGETARIVVRFAPRKAKIYRATLTLGTDDPTQPQIRVALSGRGA